MTAPNQTAETNENTDNPKSFSTPTFHTPYKSVVPVRVLVLHDDT